MEEWEIYKKSRKARNKILHGGKNVQITPDLHKIVSKIIYNVINKVFSFY